MCGWSLSLLHKRGLRALCLFLCACLALAPTAARAEADSDGFVYGVLNALFASHSDDMQALRVLYEPETGVLRMDPEGLEGLLKDYSVRAQSEGCTVTAAGREYAFAADAAAVVMRLGQAERRLEMHAPAVCRDGKYWIPADDLLYLIGVDTIPLASDGDESAWDPSRDFALFCDPAWTLPDLLMQIFGDGGAQWLFNYQQDLGLSATDIQLMFAEAAVATGMHSLLTVDLTAITQLCLENVTSVANALSRAKSAVFGDEARVFASAYEKAYFRRFIEAMASPTAAQKDALAGDLDDMFSLAEQSTEYISLAGEKLGGVTARLKYLAGKLITRFGGRADLLDGLSKRLSDGGELIGKGTNMLRVGVAVGHALDKADSMDALTLASIGRFLDASRDSHDMDAVSRKSFEKSYDSVNRALKGLTGDLVRSFVDIYGMDVLEKMGSKSAGALAFAGEVFREVWSGVESVLANVIPSQNTLETLQMSLYAVYYEADALKTASDCYSGRIVPGGFSDADLLREGGMLALNYLKACLVTTECALAVYANDARVSKTAAYARVRAKAARQAGIIDRLSTALHRLEDGDTHGALGVGFGGGMRLGAPDCGLLPLVLFRPQVLFSYDPFAPQAGVVTMYMLEGRHILCDAGADFLAWARLTDAETGFRPAPVSGGVSTALSVQLLTDGRLLAEWAVASGKGAQPGVESRYTLYDAVIGQGFRAALSGACTVAGKGSRAKITACALNGAACDAQALEAAFAACGVEFSTGLLGVGVGGGTPVGLPYYTAVAKDARSLLELRTDAVSPLPPMCEALLDQYGLPE